MKTEMLGDCEISTDGKTVWINGPDGCCLGRFSKNGIDIHKIAKLQETDGQCIDCEKGPTDIAAWHRFQLGMFAAHAVTVSAKFTPEFLRT